MPAVAVDTHAIVWYLANDPRLSSRAADAMDLNMLTMKRKPASVGELLIEGFMEPLGLTQSALAEAMGVPRKHVNELCNNRRSVTARPHSFSRVFSATAPSPGSTSNGGAISGKRCTPLKNASGSGEPDLCRLRRDCALSCHSELRPAWNAGKT
jgi:hypothetical protein